MCLCIAFSARLPVSPPSYANETIQNIIYNVSVVQSGQFDDPFVHRLLSQTRKCFGESEPAKQRIYNVYTNKAKKRLTKIATAAFGVRLIIPAVFVVVAFFFCCVLLKRKLCE